MLPHPRIKQALVVLSSASAGFYLGGRYVGGIAQPTYIESQPAWIGQAQSTMWLMLGVCALCAGLWLLVDNNEEPL